jgi:hypothetical protein
MRKLKAVLGYALAGLALVIVLATLMGMNAWEKLLVDATGVRVSPWFTGDEVVRTVTHGGYETRIHRPVFQALVGERDKGFVQVDWAPADSLPAQLEDAIDYDDDGAVDFLVRLDTGGGRAEVTPVGAGVIGLRGACRLDDGWTVRVDLLNTHR